MTNGELRFIERVPALLSEIARQLRIANKLKALELKSSTHLLGLSDDDVDAALKGERDD